jgi:hypothetical protein
LYICTYLESVNANRCLHGVLKVSEAENQSDVNVLGVFSERRLNLLNESVLSICSLVARYETNRLKTSKRSENVGNFSFGGIWWDAFDINCVSSVFRDLEQFFAK